MTESELAALEHLCDHATPGPWTANHHGMTVAFDKGAQWFIERNAGETVCQINGAAVLRPRPWVDGDARFIAATREAIPRLIAEIRRLRLVEKERDDLNSYYGDLP